MKTQKIISLLLSAALAVPTFVLTTAADGSGYSDVAMGDWYYRAVTEMTENGYMTGVSDGVFAPDAAVSRAAFLTALWRADGCICANLIMPYEDVASGEYYTEAARWAYAKKIFVGDEGKRFSPDAALSREQIAQILYLYAVGKGADAADTADITRFADHDKISEKARDAVAFCVANGLLKGTSATELSPRETATRAEAAEMFRRCLAMFNKSDAIVVLFTNDVHGGIDDDIGYAGLSAYKKSMEEKYRYVTLVDCGDFSQGSFEASVSKGEYMVDLMNDVGYDLAVFGNHEFDYGMEQLQKNVQRSDAVFLNANLSYHGEGDNWLARETKPYEIMNYGGTDVAYIGVSTPRSIAESQPTSFMEDGEYVYDFGDLDGEAAFYGAVQKYVDECRGIGADYVVVLAHLGIEEEASPYMSTELIENTSGIDVVLDAHSHTEMPSRVVTNKDGEDVWLSSTGTKLNNIGRLMLTSDGGIAVGYIEDYPRKDERITGHIAQIREEYKARLSEVVGHSDVDLLCTDAAGVRMIRSREMAIGDFVTDAYRVIGGADFAIINGGGIRADIRAGDITYEDIINVSPYGNTLCVVKVTGAEILDMLEYFYRHVQPEYIKDGKAFGEDGSFAQVSGLKLTVDTSVESTAEADETDAFTGVSGARRVKDVMILKDGEYLPIDPEAVYTMASLNYIIKQGGSGMLKFLADHELVLDETVVDYQVLIDYMNLLDSDFSRYRDADTRITVK